MPAKKENNTKNSKSSQSNGTKQSSQGSARTEDFKVAGGQVVEKVKELIREGNIRKISIKDKKGKTVVEFPMTIGVIGAVIAPVLAGVGAIAALIGECTISVEREA